MRRLLAGMLLSVLSALACPSLTTAGASDEALALLLIKKGILTQEEYEALKKEIEGVVPPAPAMAARQPAAPPVDTESAALPVDRLRDEVRDELKRRDEESVKIDAGAQIRVRGDLARNQRARARRSNGSGPAPPSSSRPRRSGSSPRGSGMAGGAESMSGRTSTSTRHTSSGTTSSTPPSASGPAVRSWYTVPPSSSGRTTSTTASPGTGSS